METFTNGTKMFKKWTEKMVTNRHLLQPSDRSHTQAVGAGLWRRGVAKTRGRAEESGAPVAELERGPRPTHRRGLSGLRGDAPRAGAAPGCGSGSAGGCWGIPPDSWGWQLMWLWAAGGPGPDRTEGLWREGSQWCWPGSSAGPLLGTSPGDKEW